MTTPISFGAVSGEQLLSYDEYANLECATRHLSEEDLAALRAAEQSLLLSARLKLELCSVVSMQRLDRLRTLHAQLGRDFGVTLDEERCVIVMKSPLRRKFGVMRRVAQDFEDKGLFSVMIMQLRLSLEYTWL